MGGRRLWLLIWAGGRMPLPSKPSSIVSVHDKEAAWRYLMTSGRSGIES